MYVCFFSLPTEQNQWGLTPETQIFQHCFHAVFLMQIRLAGKYSTSECQASLKVPVAQSHNQRKQMQYYLRLKTNTHNILL